MSVNYNLPKSEIIRLCQALVRTPSVNGTHAEHGVAEIVMQFAKMQGLEAEIIERVSARPNVVVKVGPDTNPGLLLVAHMDTVSAGREENWTYPPFGAEIVGGRLYGRGAIDNKGGLVAALTALLMLKEHSRQLQQPVWLACVPDEESGATGELGVRYLKEHDKLDGCGAIYTYPGMSRIIIGHRGVLRFKIIVRGKASHSGSLARRNTRKAVNAVVGMSEIVLALECMSFDDISTDPFFANFETVITPTLISGGADKSIVPDYCEATVDVRLVPTTPQEMVEKKIREVIAGIVQRRGQLTADVKVITYVPPTVISPEADVVVALKQSAMEILGKELPLAVSGPANESYILNGFGVPTCVFGPVGANAHAANEYVVIDSIFRAGAVYAKTARLINCEGS